MALQERSLSPGVCDRETGRQEVSMRATQDVHMQRTAPGLSGDKASHCEAAADNGQTTHNQTQRASRPAGCVRIDEPEPLKNMETQQ